VVHQRVYKPAVAISEKRNPASAPSRCRRHLLGQTQAGVWSHRRRLRTAAGVQAVPIWVGQSVRTLPPAACARRATGQSAPAALLGSGSSSGFEPMPPPAAPLPSSSSWRPRRACVSRPADPSCCPDHRLQLPLRLPSRYRRRLRRHLRAAASIKAAPRPVRAAPWASMPRRRTPSGPAAAEQGTRAT
jgi:hypothetical protein